MENCDTHIKHTCTFVCTRVISWPRVFVSTHSRYVCNDDHTHICTHAYTHGCVFTIPRYSHPLISLSEPHIAVFPAHRRSFFIHAPTKQRNDATVATMPIVEIKKKKKKILRNFAKNLKQKKNINKSSTTVYLGIPRSFWRTSSSNERLATTIMRQ